MVEALLLVGAEGTGPLLEGVVVAAVEDVIVVVVVVEGHSRQRRLRNGNECWQEQQAVRRRGIGS